LKADQLTSIQMKIDKEELIEGMQFELLLPETVKIEQIKSGKLLIDESNYNVVDDHSLRFIWSSATAIQFNEDDVLFTIDLMPAVSATLDQASLSTSSHLEAEVYRADGTVSNLSLNVEEQTIAVEHHSYELFQNEPNPFKSQTLIRFRLAKDAYAELTIFDAAGKLVYSENGSFVKGLNEIKIDLNKINDSKLFIYSIKTDEFFATRKMIRSN